jgi:urease accessory protein
MNLDPAIGTKALPGSADALGRSTRKAHEDARAPRGGNPDSYSDAAWLCGLLQAGDSFFPTGSYAHSFGLEGLVQEGVVHDAATLRAYVFQAALPALRHTELPLAAEAWRALGGPDWASLRELSTLSSALRTPREARVASENIGRQRSELAARLRSSAMADEYLRRARDEGWPFSAPIAAALEGRVLGAPLTAVLAGVTYASLASLLSAAMKLLRLGQNGAQSLLTEALGTAPELITAAANTPRDEIGWFNPWLDIASARHETADARMFIS